jgi:hypothetical protein
MAATTVKINSSTVSGPCRQQGRKCILCGLSEFLGNFSEQKVDIK